MTNELAIRIITGDVLGTASQTSEAIRMAVKALSMPSAQPERKTGAWIAVDHFADGKPVYREWECSACRCVAEDEKPTWNFCPMCGADMRSERDMH